MTTDTVPKAVSRQVVIDGRTVTVTGISDGQATFELTTINQDGAVVLSGTASGRVGA